MRIELVQGDITTFREVDAVVTAANRRLLGGTGVNGAVHAAAGPRLLAASAALAPCQPGSAVVTPAFDLAPVRWIIHAVGPRYRSPDDAPVLQFAYSAALARADECGARTVSFPSISTGRYGYPAKEAAALSVHALQTARTEVDRVLLVAFSDDAAELWASALATGCT